MGRWRLAIAVALLVAAAGCGKSGSGSSHNGNTGTQGLGEAPLAATTNPPPTNPPATTTPPKPTFAPLTCAKLRNAQLGTKTVSFNGYHDSVPLSDGIWAGEDGANVELQDKCGIGDMDGDGSKDGIGVVKLTTGGTGSFYHLVLWRNASGTPVTIALAELGDRTPVLSIAIAGQKATVVYLTRTDDAPAAMVNLKRTAVFERSGGKLVELNHSDVPYTP